MVTQAEISTRLGTARREGREEGREENRREMILKILAKGASPQEVADLLDIPLSDVLAVRG